MALSTQGLGGPYQGYKGGYSYGLEFHFRWEKEPGGGAVVFNVVDGCIWARLPPNKNTQGYDSALDKAAELCRELNGNPRTYVE